MKKRILAFFAWSLITGICGTALVLMGIFLHLSPSLPDVENLRDIKFQTPLRIFSTDGKLIGEFGEKRREPIRFEDTPGNLVNAILSAEDDGFYRHNGVAFSGLARAVSELVLTGSIQSGGSTITMQVARNFFLSRDQTFSRKFNEILLALKIENELNKDDILELYLNKIYLGKRAYGFKAAAKVYYGRELTELSLAQTAMIAGLPKAPSTFNPIANPDRAIIRRNWILGRMLSLGSISEEEHNAAILDPVTATFHTQKLDLHAPYVAEMAREKAIELFGEEAYTGGYNITVTVDSKLQIAGQHAIIEGLLAYTKRHGYRGPEATLNTDKLNVVLTEKNILPESTNLAPWISELQARPNFGGLLPAAVIATHDKSLKALLPTGQIATVKREDGLHRAGRYINENFYSPVPKKVSSIVKLGDVIRLRRLTDKNGQPYWQFNQIPKIQGGLVALDPHNGAIRTIVGGFDFQQNAFNRITQAKRLPGSNFKPFLYSIALNNGFTPASIFNDAPLVIEDGSPENTWRPENSSGKFYGPTRLRKALYLSRNIVSIRLLRTLGINKAKEGLGSFGIDANKLSSDLSISLGTYSMTPLEVATGYTVFANNGHKVTPFLVDHISDSQGNIVFKETRFSTRQAKINTAKNPLLLNSVQTNNTLPATSPSTIITTTDKTIASSSLPHSSSSELTKQTHADKTLPAPRVLDERVTYIMNSILRDVVQRGTAKKAKQLERTDIGGKTGTTNGPTDAWFSGFNQHLVTTAWVGFDNNSKIGKREYGGTAALPIWIDFMKVALADIPDQLPPQPDGIVTVKVDPTTGRATPPNNPDGITEIFLKETAPEPAPATANGLPKDSDSVKPEDIF